MVMVDSLVEKPVSLQVGNELHVLFFTFNLKDCSKSLNLVCVLFIYCYGQELRLILNDCLRNQVVEFKGTNVKTPPIRGRGCI